MGIGSKLKKAIKKIVPKELGDVAQVAAFIPGPHQPIAAGLAALGGYRDDGFSGALKKGLGSYMGGQFTSGLAKGSQFGPDWMQKGFGSGKTWLPSSMKESGFTPLDWLGDPIRGTGEKTGEGIQNLFGGQSKLLGDESIVLDSTGDGAVMEAVYGVNPNIVQGQDLKQISKLLGNPDIALGDKTKMLQALNVAPGEWDKIIKGGEAFGWEHILKGLLAGFLTEEENRDQPQFRSWEEIPTNMYNLQYENAKDGGIIGLANGGQPTMEMDYRGGGFIPVGAQERADDVPARLSKNEFVMTADAVRAAGGGSVDVGAQRMYNLMNQLEGAA